MARSHYYRPVTDDAGNLIPNITVRLLEPGTTTAISAVVYAGPSGSTAYTPPWVVPNGVIDFYLLAPKRVRIGVLAPGQTEFFLENEDVAPPADQILVAPTPFVIANPPAAGKTLVATGAGSGQWVATTTYLRSTAVFSTGSLAANGTGVGAIALAPSYHLISLGTSGPARVRLYSGATKRTADLGRAVGTDPVGDHGLMFEFVSTALVLEIDCAPSVVGANTEEAPGPGIPISVTNLTNGAATVTVTAVFTGME